MLEKLLSEAVDKAADLTFCRIRNFKRDGSLFISEEKNLDRVVLDKDIRYFFSEGENRVRNVILRILYKADKFKTLRFNEKMISGEDAVFLYDAIALSDKNAVIHDPLYLYSWSYDNPKIAYNKYFQDKMDLKERYKFLTLSIGELCDKFNFSEFGKAAVYSIYLKLVGLICKDPEYRKYLKFLDKDEYWNTINTKENYYIHKKYFNGKKTRLKSYLIHKKRYRLFRLIVLIT